MQVIEKKTSPLQKCLNRFDLHIVETLKTNFIDSKRDHFTISIGDKCSKDPLYLRREQCVEFNRVTMEWLNSGMVEWRNIHNEECFVTWKNSSFMISKRYLGFGSEISNGQLICSWAAVDSCLDRSVSLKRS